MDNKRQNVFQWKTKLSTPFVVISVCGMLMFTLVFGILVSVTMSNQMTFNPNAQNIWRISFLVFILIQLAANASLLFIIFNTLHKTIGAFPRIENNLEKVLNGDYSIRIGVRKKDNEHVASLASKINKVLEVLESKAK
ncbi:MAG: hypothetical protein PHS64_02735 [Candidatus Omnitrophica bacterium]|nr:hypothetical protein [Candidatus Omnitrophota bacterium]MDD5774841.1 hypothetical protein [Candidatus Omnitrophota bacterium]